MNYNNYTEHSLKRQSRTSCRQKHLSADRSTDRAAKYALTVATSCAPVHVRWQSTSSSSACIATVLQVSTTSRVDGSDSGWLLSVHVSLWESRPFSIVFIHKSFCGADLSVRFVGRQIGQCGGRCIIRRACINRGKLQRPSIGIVICVSNKHKN